MEQIGKQSVTDLPLHQYSREVNRLFTRVGPGGTYADFSVFAGALVEADFFVEETSALATSSIATSSAASPTRRLVFTILV